MTTNKQQMLRNPDVQPTSDVMKEVLKQANEAYLKFVQALDRYDIQLVWHYYTDGKAWLAKGRYQWTGVRGGQNEKTLFWLSIWDGFFKVTIYIPQKARTAVLNLPLDEELRQQIAEINQMGKLKFFPVVFDLYSDEMFEAIFTIADFLKSVK